MDTTENVVVALGETKMHTVKKSLSSGDNLESDGKKLGGDTNDSGMVEATGNEFGSMDAGQEGQMVLKSFPVGVDDKIASDDKGIELDMAGDVVASGKVHEEKKGKKRKKRSKRDNAVSVATISETSENEGIEGTEMLEQNGAQEGALLKSSLLGGDGNIIFKNTTDQGAAENGVTTGNLQKGEKLKKKKPKKCKKKALSVDVNTEQNMDIEGEKLASQTHNNVVGQITGNQTLEVTEICDGAQEGCLLPTSSLVGANDAIIPKDKTIGMDLTENVVTFHNLHEEKRDEKMPETLEMKKAPAITVDTEKILQTEGEKVANQTLNSVIEQATENQTAEGTEIHDSPQPVLVNGVTISQNSCPVDLNKECSDLLQISEGSYIVNENGRQYEKIIPSTDGALLESTNKSNEIPEATIIEDLIMLGKSKDNEVCANNVVGQSDVAADQEMQTLESGSLMKTKSIKRKKPVNSHLEELKDTERLLNQILEVSSVKDTNIYTVKSSQVIERDANVSKEHVVTDSHSPCIKFNQETQLSQNQTTADFGENICKLENVLDTKKNNAYADHCVTASEVAVLGVENPNACKKKRVKKKRKLSNLSQPDLIDEDGEKDGNMESTSVNDGDSKHSKEGNIVAPGEGIPMTDSISEVAVIDIANPNTCKKKKKKKSKRKRKLSSVSQSELNDNGGEKDRKMESSSVNDEESKNSREENNVTPGEGIHLTDSISEVAVIDIANSNTCKKKMSKRKRKLSSVSQLELNDKGGEKDIKMESSSVNDEESKSSREEKNVTPGEGGEGIPLTDSMSEVAVLDIEIPNTCKKKWAKMKLKSSSVSLSDLNDKDGEKERNIESSSVNDGESKDFREGNDVAIGEGIPLTASLSVSDSMKDVCRPVSSGEAITINEKILLPPPKSQCDRPSSRKLLILDINGLLADIVAPVPCGYKPDIMLSRKAVFKRPFCETFLKFCFEKFDVGVWSSRVKMNVDKALDFLMGEMKSKLVFYWDRSHCTITGFPTIENRDKPLVLKELRKLWDDPQFHLGKYDQTNTLLLDDSPYKALCNPDGTAIFPVSYQYKDVNDCSLGPEGDLRVYLEKLAMAENIPEFVRNNHFGQRPIRNTNLSWNYYKKVIDSHNSRGKR